MTTTSTSASNTAATVVTVAAAAASAAAIAAASIYNRYRKCLEQIAQNEATIAKLEETRSSERKGRIRAEMKLRTQLKQEEANAISENGAETHAQNADANMKKNGDVSCHSNESKTQNNLLLQCIGTIVSPYTKRMGTPRQGALVPSGRGFVQLRIPVECIEGLESYSHAWIIFTFHANTDTPTATTIGSATNTTSSKLNFSKTKIRPPRGNGIKVGMLATRSPHRPNNVGLSLVKISGVDKKEKRLHIQALDLVNGTPVYDIKPCVPWDLPGHHDKVPLTVPTWVSQDDALQTVEFTTLARESLERHVRNGKLSPLYTCKNNGIAEAMETIREILAQDPRSSNTNGPNKRGSTSTSSGSMKEKQMDTYKFVLCSVEVEFRVCSNGVTVENVSDLDLNGVQYVDGIPVLLNGR